jgi:hypothetical protein
MRLFFQTILMIAMFSLIGCGGGDSGVPGTLTPEEEKEILDQVEGAAAEEA